MWRSSWRSTRSSILLPFVWARLLRRRSSVYVVEEGGHGQIVYNGETVVDEDMTVMRDIWEETSYQLEKRQCNPICATEVQSVFLLG